jgi:hypothetical protein
MMTWMSDGFANPPKEIERPGLRDRQTEEYLSDKEDEKNFAKGVSHLFRRILTYFEQSFNRSMTTPKVKPGCFFAGFSLNISSKRPAIGAGVTLPS